MNFIRRYSSLRSSSHVCDEFKSSMSRVSSQAMILTAGFRDHQKTKEPKINSLHGMTLSSVCSLSVYPTPMLSFNLHLPSYTSKTLHENEGVIAIHLLDSSSNSSKLGRIFASGVKHNKQQDGEVFHEMATPFKKLDPSCWRFLEYEDYKIPILKDSERIFICDKKTVLEIDNHEIWVVNVLDILGSKDQKSGGLLYFDRSFHRIGEVI